MKSIPIPSPGDVISEKYRLDEVLGKGGFGMVFRATHLEMDRPVALKTLLPGAAASEEAAERFKREAVLASSLKHQNIITLFDYGQTREGLLFLVMELLNGRTLKQEMLDHGAINPERAARIVGQVLESLSVAHGQDIIHLDLKPENIFLCDIPGRVDFVKVLDFGIARMIPQDPTNQSLSQSLTFGTPRYMAPEQISALPVGPQTDLYALGLIAHEMLTGEPAYQGRTPLEVVAKQLNSDVPPLPAHLQQTLLGAVIARTAVKDFDNRLVSATEALRILRGEISAPPLVGGAPAPVAAPAPAPIISSDGVGSSLMMGGAAASIPSDIDAGWMSGGGDFNLTGESILPDDVGAGPMDDERTWVAVAPSERLESEDMTAQLMVEGTFDGGGGEMGDGPTRVLDEFDAAPTQAIFQLDPSELQILQDGPDEMESEPTRVHVSRSAIQPAVERPKPKPAAGPSSTVKDTEKTDPGLQAMDKSDPVAQRAPDAPAEKPAVLFSVGSEAGYIGNAHNVPGVHAPANDDLAQRELAARAQRTGRMAAIPTAAQPFPQAAPAPRRAIDRTLVAALAFLGMGMIAVLTVLIVILLMPLIRQPQTPPPVASGAAPGTAPAPVTPAPSAAVEPAPTPGPEAAANAADAGVAVAEATPDAASEPDAEAEAPMPVIKVTSKPEGAEVFVGEESVGKTPLELKQDKPNGELVLALKLDKYKDASKKVAFDADQTVHVDLVPVPPPAPPAPVAQKTTPAPAPAVRKPVAAAPAPTRKPVAAAPAPTRKPAANTPAKKPAATTPAKKPNPFGKW